MKFDVTGPFEITRYGTKKNITKESIKDLKTKLEQWEEGLSESCGCYVFAKSAGGGIIPWYVGQACKNPMLKEVLNPVNITKYNEILDDKGKPLIFIIPARTPKGKLRKRPVSNNLSELDFLEKWLIATSIDKNTKLINNKETKFLRNLHVVGIFNSKKGEATKASQMLKKTLW